ncbi:hypothetical protein AXX17_AT1G62340 [Arabidopsis thaliana]|uniref:Aspergillus nuclease S1 n=1 Tax=Arabidopsis thaliana TaxID=3702 RepID=A0A178WC85_ARATH|nr:hypothetical protein AXX17_AT1G62340 [Arabidopsis thaliana]
MGDIHQPLHVSYASDKGGNTIEVHWYTRKANLHHIWDSNIIETAEADLYNSALEGMVDALKKNITVLMQQNYCSLHVCYKVFLTC